MGGGELGILQKWFVQGAYVRRGKQQSDSSRARWFTAASQPLKSVRSIEYEVRPKVVSQRA
jgi:hypothetical protein